MSNLSQPYSTTRVTLYLNLLTWKKYVKDAQLCCFQRPTSALHWMQGACTCDDRKMLVFFTPSSPYHKQKRFYSFRLLFGYPLLVRSVRTSYIHPNRETAQVFFPSPDPRKFQSFPMTSCLLAYILLSCCSVVRHVKPCIRIRSAVRTIYRVIDYWVNPDLG